MKPQNAFFVTCIFGIGLLTSCASKANGDGAIQGIEKIKTPEPDKLVTDIQEDSVAQESEPKSNLVPAPEPVVIKPPGIWRGDSEPYPLIDGEIIYIEQVPDTIDRSNEINDFPDVKAKFPGGDKAMIAFINKGLEYPSIDILQANQGTVLLSFVVEKDGSLSSIVVDRGVTKTLDQEAERILQQMPKWKPASVRGKPVRSRMRIPLKFKMEE